LAKQVILEDFIEAKESIGVEKLEEDKYLVRLESSNHLHHPFYKHITYFVSRQKHLIRIESFKKFDIKNMNDDFFAKAYIDRVLDDIEYFEVVALKDNPKAFTIFLKQKKHNIIINALRN
jgi:hypothetical protein